MISKYKKYKTRVGHDVAIYEVYTEGPHPVHGAYFFDGAWTLEAWTSDGFTMAGIENEQDIFEAEVIDGSLTARLRAEEINEFATHPEGLLAEAADRIEQLEAALRDVIDAWDWWQVDTYDRCGSVPDDAIRNARAALGEKKDGN
jgi:hypothetical protein